MGTRRRAERAKAPAEPLGPPVLQDLPDSAFTLWAEAGSDPIAWHAALLGGSAPGNRMRPAQRIHLIQQLQRMYGNGHVARVVAVLQRAPAAPCAEPPAKPLPKAPEEDPKFRAVIGKIGTIASREKKHPPPG
jgi:hypothetical protein